MAARPKTEELFEAFMVQLLRRLPITWASGLGGEIGAMRGRSALKGTSLWVQRLRRNIATLSMVPRVSVQAEYSVLRNSSSA
jgi:hypothetical protein